MITIESRKTNDEEWEREAELNLFRVGVDFIKNDLTRLCAYICVERSDATNSRVNVRAIMGGPPRTLVTIDTVAAAQLLKR